MAKKRKTMTVNEWRNKHRRCEFCAYLQRIVQLPGCITDEDWCKAKHKPVHPARPRPFCRVFQLKED